MWRDEEGRAEQWPMRGPRKGGREEVEGGWWESSTYSVCSLPYIFDLNPVPTMLRTPGSSLTSSLGGSLLPSFTADPPFACDAIVT